MKKILILQNTIMTYRQPVYNGLAQWYGVTVLHAGPKSVGPDDHYREIIVPAKKAGPFFLQRGANIRRRMKDYDVVIAMFDLRWPACLSPLFLARNRPKFILWGHRYSTNKFANSIRDHIMKRADMLLMYGDEEVKQMVERGIDSSKIALAWNTIHVPNHRDTSQTAKTSLLFVGRLQASKHIELLIEAFAHLQGRIPQEVTVEIVGSGDEEAALRQCAKNLGVADKIHFFGRTDDPDELVVIFSRAVVHVSPGPIGLSALHSMAYGVPVITNNLVRYGPEFHNLRHGHNALLVETREEMEQAIEKLCNDFAYAASLGKNAYRHYSQKRSLKRMLAGFREAIEGRLE